VAGVAAMRVPLPVTLEAAAMRAGSDAAMRAADVEMAAARLTTSVMAAATRVEVAAIRAADAEETISQETIPVAAAATRVAAAGAIRAADAAGTISRKTIRVADAATQVAAVAAVIPTTRANPEEGADVAGAEETATPLSRT
jgi:hypothetical protein